MGKDRGKRIAEFDALRAISMLWIVGVLHFSEYTVIAGERLHVAQYGFSDVITTGALMAFTFLSGYFCRGDLNGKKDVAAFYIKKFKRFYPLYFIALSGMYAASILFSLNFITSPWQFISCCLGLNMFIYPYPVTLWYFGMIIFLYAITPIFNSLKSDKNKVIAAVIIYAVIFAAVVVLKGDDRILLYYPAYCFGLIFGKYAKSKRSTALIKLVVSAAVTALAVYISELLGNPYYMKLVYGITCAYGMYMLSVLLAGRFTNRIFYTLSYLSMCAYLFHRLFYGTVAVLHGRFNILLAYFAVLPCLLVLSYAVQYCYDAVVKALFKKK